MTTSINLTRDSGYADRIRDYRVMLDGQEIGRIANGETKAFEIAPGTHNLKIKIDWCGSNEIQVSVNAGESVSCSCRRYEAYNYCLRSSMSYCFRANTFG
jgi:hypothetical protein